MEASPYYVSRSIVTQDGISLYMSKLCLRLGLTSVHIEEYCMVSILATHKNKWGYTTEKLDTFAYS